jgi:hypothetical protein
MFDYFNTENLNLNPSKWLNSPLLEGCGFAIEVIESTGEILNKKRIAEFNGLKFNLSPDHQDGYRAILSGSLHKFWNNGEFNSNRFTFADVCKTIEVLQQDFGIDPTKAVLHSLEIGVNIKLKYNPVEVFKALIVYGNKPFVPLNENPRLGRVCKLTEYEIKFYDKGFAEQKYNANLLRIEVRFNKMRNLKKFDLFTLSDLLDPTKVALLIDLLTDAIQNSIFIQHDANLESLTEREQMKFHTLRIPDEWQKLTKKQRFDSCIGIRRILEKCNAFNFKSDLLPLVKNEWKTLLNVPFEAVKNVTFSPLLIDSEALENVTFSPLEYRVKRLLSGGVNLTPNFLEQNAPPPTLQRCCLSCGKSIETQRAKSVFCSEKYNGQNAKKCRNKDSNRRRDLKQIIMKAQIKNQWIRVYYRNLDDPEQTYSDVLHSSEIVVNRGWLNTIIKIEVLAEQPAPLHFGEPIETLEGEQAKELLDDLTAQNLKEKVRQTVI